MPEPVNSCIASTENTMPLDKYREKRDFTRTLEPPGDSDPSGIGADTPRRYVIQKHHARTLHYDLRLEDEGVLKSWAVPKGPSLDPAEKHLAVAVEDHPLEYGDFEGSIPEGEYGGGKVIVWDFGTFEPIGEGETFSEMLDRGAAKIRLKGKKLEGGFALIRTRWGGKDKNWLLIKEKDQYARPGYNVTKEEPLSVLSGRDVDEVE